jgi:hypothetical protein
METTQETTTINQVLPNTDTLIKFDDLKQQTKLIKALSKLWKYTGNQLNLNDLPSECFQDSKQRLYWGMVTADNVCMIIPKTANAQKVLLSFVDVEDYKPLKNKPTLSYCGCEHSESQSKFNNVYLSRIMDILGVTQEGIKLSVIKNYPLTAENNDFQIILAPRVDEA